MEAVQALVDAGADVLALNGTALLTARLAPERADILAVLEKAFADQTRAAADGFDGKSLFDAARAGLFPKLAAAALARGDKLDAAEVAAIELTRGRKGCFIVGMLEARGQLSCLLDYRLWSDPETAFCLFAARLNGETRARFEEDAQGALQKMHADNLSAAMREMRKKYGDPKFRL
jgi:hypothetical protein